MQETRDAFIPFPFTPPGVRASRPPKPWPHYGARSPAAAAGGVTNAREPAIGANVTPTSCALDSAGETEFAALRRDAADAEKYRALARTCSRQLPCGTTAQPTAVACRLRFWASGQLDRSGAVTTRVGASAMACPDCDLLQHVPPLPPRREGALRALRLRAREPAGRSARPAAGARRSRRRSPSSSPTSSPLMDLSAVGRTASTTIVGGAYQMWMEGEPITGVARRVLRGASRRGLPRCSC